jgi:transposase
MPLQARVFVCEACGNNCNRDLNAAINLASISKNRVIPIHYEVALNIASRVIAQPP